MQNQKLSDLTLLLFFLVIFSVPVYWIIQGKYPQEYSLIEGRELSTFADVSREFSAVFENLPQENPGMVVAVIRSFDRVFFRGIQKAAADQFPLRIQATQISRSIDRQIISLAYAFLPDPAIPTDTQSGLYIMRDKSQIFLGPAIYNEIIKQTIDASIDNYSSLIRAYPDINFHAFYLELLEHSKYHPLNSYFPEADRGQTFLYFEKNKPNDLLLGKMMLAGFEDHLKYYYRTDHHWNIQGILRAYYGIHELLAQNYLEISPPIELGDFYTFQDIGFLGYFARKSLYPIQPDRFEVVLYELPPYTILENGQKIIYNQSAQYLAGNYSLAAYTNHLCQYYGGDRALLEYVFGNGSNRNLLIFGNSYDNPLIPLLAYHYHHTYSIDLRYYQNFSLSDFLSQYDIDDILFVSSKVFDLFW